MKRTWNTIKDADISKIKMRSKTEIIKKILELEQKYDIADDKMWYYEEKWEIATSQWYDVELIDIRRTVSVLDWVLNINN